MKKLHNECIDLLREEGNTIELDEYLSYCDFVFFYIKNLSFKVNYNKYASFIADMNKNFKLLKETKNREQIISNDKSIIMSKDYVNTGKDGDKISKGGMTKRFTKAGDVIFLIGSGLVGCGNYYFINL